MSTAAAVTLPVVMPLLMGALTLSAWRSVMWQRRLGLIGCGVMALLGLWQLDRVLSDGVLVVQIGSWAAPFGISLVADTLSALLVFLTGLVAGCTALYAHATIDDDYTHFGYYPLMFLLLAGVNGAFLTGDLFNLFVWFEVMLVASFALLILGGERKQMEGAIKYVTINLLSSALFLSAIGLLYGALGTLNFADLAQKIEALGPQPLIDIIALMLLVSFGIKAGVFPLYFWLPASYHTPRVAVSALFAGLLTKVGVYVIYRVYTVVFPLDSISFLRELLLALAAATMIVGALGALTQTEFRRILSFQIIAGIGFLIMALALGSPAALVGGVLYLMHHIVVMAALFLISGLIFRYQGSHTLSQLGGLYREHPFSAMMLLVALLGLAGVPPLSGFFAKLVLLQAALAQDQGGMAAVVLGVSVLTLWSMVIIWSEVAWKDRPEHPLIARHPRRDQGTAWMRVSILMLILGVVGLGLGIAPIAELAQQAVDQLQDRSGYITAILGAPAP